jgi:O-antigen/teichoic acid export membrane protein
MGRGANVWGGMNQSLPVSYNMLVGSVCAIVQIGANLVSYPIFLYYLGYRQYGVWLVLAVVLSVVQFVAAGVGPSLTQAAAESASRSRREDIWQYVLWCSIATVSCGGLLLLMWPAAMGVTRAAGMDGSISEAVVTLGPWLALVGSMTLAAECTSALVAGIGKIHWVYVANALGQIVLLIASAALLSAGVGIASVLIGFATARVVGLMMLGPMLSGAVRGVRLSWVPSMKIAKRLLKSSGLLLAGTTLNVFMVPFNRWCIAAVAGPSAVPVFDIGYTGSMQIRNVLEFGLRSLVPEAAGLKGVGRRQAILALHARWTVRVMCAGAALYGVAALTAPFLLGLWLRDGLAAGQVETFRMFLVAGFFSLLGTPAYYLLVALRRMGGVFWSYALQAALNGGLMIAALAWKVPHIVLFAAGAMSFAMFVSALWLIVLLRIARSEDEAPLEDPACCPV